MSEDSLATLPVTTIDGSETDLQWAINQADDLHLLIPVYGPSTRPKPTPDLNGIKVRHRYLEAGQFLDIVANPAHEDVFNPLCEQIINAVIDQQREPWAAVDAIIRNWLAALKSATRQMSESEQVGLFGELFVLERLMIPALGPAAVYQWAGPDYERHDFVGNRIHLEVKTTRSRNHKHEISAYDQLRTPPGKQLLLVSVLIEQSIGGDDNLAARYDAMSDLLRGDAAAYEEFRLKMFSMNWSDDMRSSGELLSFFVRDGLTYEVDDKFPKLPDDFVPATGVVAVKYTIDLANLPHLTLDEAIEMVRAGNPQLA